MISFTESEDLKKFIDQQRAEGRTIGFIPTMGALHQGHMSLIKGAKEECDIAVCSIFVNPTQFNKSDDLVKYPRTLEADEILLNANGCDAVFAPSVEEIYPEGTNNFQAPDVGEMLGVLEGEHRPGHFEGMMQVVSLLLDKVNPTHMYMGLKDYQQFAICCEMVRLQGRDVEMRGMPIFRENNGLAMSSRNMRLSAEAKENAKIIFESLSFVKENAEFYDLSELIRLAKAKINSVEGMQCEYFEIVDKITLLAPQNKENLIALTAAWTEEVRLIDNMIL